jgi:general secretion pathway protein C
MNRTGILIANGALLVLSCFLAARILAAVAAELLAPPPAEAAVLSQPVDPAGHGANDPQVILSRNLFEVSTLGPQPAEDEEVYAETTLALRLLGTAASPDPAHSMAAVEDLDTRQHLVVRPNDELKGRARVIRIDRRRIVLQNGPRREELRLEETPPRAEPRRSARNPPSRRRSRASTRPALDDMKANIRQLGKDRFSVPRADVESMANNPAALFSQARILPKYHQETGEMMGVQLNSIKAGSLFEQIGIQEGDTITEFNGIQVTGQQESAQVLRELTEAEKFDVSVTSASGETRRLRYELR